MIQQLRRYTAPLLARIPDVSEVPTGRLIVIGVVVSLLLHLFLFLMIPLITWFFPEKGPKFSDQALKPRELELTVLPDEPAHPFTLEPKPERLFMDSRGLDIAKEAPETPLFESDEDMKAASELPSMNGDMPLPTQEGKERPSYAFQQTRSLLGPLAQPFAPPSPPLEQPLTSPPPPTPPPMPVPPAPQAAQQAAPAPKEKESPPAPTPPPAQPEKKEPTEAKEPAKPTDLPQVEKPAEDQIVLMKRESIPEAITEILKPNSTPSPVAHAAVLRPLDDEKPATPAPKAQPTPVDKQVTKIATPAPTPRPPDTQVAKLSTPMPRPQPPQVSGYQPEQEKNHIEGAISNRGRAAVDAIGTPMARYRKQVNDAIGSRWYYYIRDKMDLLAFGSVRISFVIDSRGHISRTRVEANSSNRSLAEVSMRAIEEAEIGPPPKDPSGVTSQEPLDWTLTFTYYPFSQ